MRVKRCWERDGWWLALAASLLISLPYLLSSQSFFSSDDWVHLRFNRPIQPWEVWRYFSPRVIWFYRPFQALQFGWLYHAFGLRPLAYNLSLFAMHLGVCLLVYLLARRLVTARTAVLTTVLFAAQWAYVDVLLWPSNFSTLHWAMVTLALCILFLRYLECRRPWLLVGVYFLLMVDFIAKEQAVCTLLLLGALWWWNQLSPAAESGLPGSRREALKVPGRLTEAVRLIGPAGMLTLVFTWAHGHLFHDVYQGYGRLDYRLAPPRQLLQQWLFAFNHVLLSFHRDPVLLPQLPPLLQAVRFLVERFLALPLFMGGLAWWRKDRTLGLGLLWVFASLVPVAWLVGGHTARFYYLPAVGSALIVAHGMECCWQASVRWKARPERPRIQLLARSTQVGVTLGLVYLLIVNLSMITLSALRYHEESDLIFAAYSTLRKQSGQIPRGSLLVMRNIPASLFVNGIGLPDMVRVALGDPTAQAAIEGEILPYNWLARLHRIPTQFVMDFSVQPLTIQSLTRLSTGGAAARAFPRANTAPALIEPQVRIRA